jgi:adenylate cyclase
MMGIEIERKFLVAGDGWRPLVTRSQSLRQAYLADRGATIRVRIVDMRQAFLTIKGAAKALIRPEFEYEIPVADAVELMKLRIGSEITKRRHHLDLAGGDWVLDEFGGPHAGLFLAEVELPHADAEFPHPDWLGPEVTGDTRYYNSTLAALPPA